MAVSYGSFNFPSPLPIAAWGDEPIYVAGELDGALTRITLVGAITGSNLSGLSVAKKQMISGLLSEYQTLAIEGESFTYCKPTSLNFSESDLTTILPYSIEFERYDKKSFSQYYGVLNPTNVWTYSEQQGRVVQASHSVSAQGVKTGSADPLATARTFVNSKLTGFQNLSIINPSGTAFLTSKTEEVDRFQNIYSVTENYSFSTSREPITNSGIVSANAQINYVKGGESSVAVNGSIFGNITGAQVTTGMFTPTNAQNFALNAIERSKSQYESGIYGVLAKGPTSYNYDINTGENKIDFSFQFKDPFNVRTGDVLNEYTVAVSATKDNNTLTAAINGTLSYDSSFDIFSGGAIEISPRYLKILAEFNSLNFYALAQEKYSEFIDVVSGYETSKYLNPIPLSESVTKNPYTPNITYSYSYDNRVDISSGQLKNLSIQITDTLPISKTQIQESNNGFATQQTVSRTLGKLQVSASCEETGAKLPLLKQVSSGYLFGKNCQIFEENWNTGDSTTSYQIGSYY